LRDLETSLEIDMASASSLTSLTHGNIASPEASLQAAMEWTTEDFLAAEPYPMPEITESMVADFIEKMTSPSAKGGSTSPGGAPSADGESDGTGPGDDKVTGYPYPPPFNQHEVLANYGTYPYCTIGKLFFTQGGRNYVGSAAAIGKNGIWTAGHCVHVGNGQPSGWSTNVVFVPGYKDGAAPFGQFTARQLFCRTSWYQKGNPGGLFEDMGGAILNPLNGRMLSQVVGWLGFAWNFPRNQVWTSLGYPAAPPFTGQRMFQDTAPYANDGAVPGSPAPEGIGCSMTGGCSGGPWVIGLGSANHVNGHNSYRPNSQPLEIYSPYFGDNSRSLMQLVVV
jgi:V8-like Glu-specific endopeptidase